MYFAGAVKRKRVAAVLSVARRSRGQAEARHAKWWPRRPTSASIVVLYGRFLKPVGGVKWVSIRNIKTQSTMATLAMNTQPPQTTLVSISARR